MLNAEAKPEGTPRERPFAMRRPRRNMVYHLETRDLSICLTDNEAVGIHGEGRNGVASLIPKALGNNLFVPTDGGMTYESSVYGDLNRSRDDLYEPRHAPCYVIGANAERVVLLQPATEYKGIEAHISFFVEEPHYVHQTIRLTFQKRAEPPARFAGVWGNYLYMPPDRHVYLRRQAQRGALDGWVGVTKADPVARDYQIRLLPPRELDVHGHLGAMEHTSALPQAPRLDGALPFYYGLYYDHLFLMMFKEAERVRLAYSPCGGGTAPAWSPAWSYQLVLDDVVPGQFYEWHVCLVCKPFVSREDVLDEVHRYRGT